MDASPSPFYESEGEENNTADSKYIEVLASVGGFVDYLHITTLMIYFSLAYGFVSQGTK